MTLVKLTLQTDNNLNGVQVWFHTDEIRRVLPLPQGSAIVLLSGEEWRFQESSDFVAAIVNAAGKSKVGRPIKYDEKNQESI